MFCRFGWRSKPIALACSDIQLWDSLRPNQPPSLCQAQMPHGPSTCLRLVFDQSLVCSCSHRDIVFACSVRISTQCSIAAGFEPLPFVPWKRQNMTEYDRYIYIYIKANKWKVSEYVRILQLHTNFKIARETEKHVFLKDLLQSYSPAKQVTLQAELYHWSGWAPAVTEPESNPSNPKQSEESKKPKKSEIGRNRSNTTLFLSQHQNPNAKPCQAMPSHAKPCQAMPSHARPCQACGSISPGLYETKRPGQVKSCLCTS